MRLLHVTHQYWPAIGGSEQFMTDLSEELVRREHFVDVITSQSKNILSLKSDLSAYEKINGVNVYRFASMARYRFIWHILKYGNEGLKRTKSRFYEPFIMFATGPIVPGLAWHILRQGRQYDLIHIQTLPYFHFVYAYLCARAVGRPIIVTPHLHVDQPEVFDLKIFNSILRSADMVTVVSEREIPYLTARGVNRDRILLAGNGIKLKEFPSLSPVECRVRQQIPSDAFVLLFLGRKVAYKGLRTVLKAFAQLQKRYSSLYLVSAGPPTQDSQNLMHEFENLPRWLDLNVVSEAQKIDLLNACNVLILPSTGEAFGIVFLEAWAVGKPVIGARAGAIPNIISENQDGLLVDPNDDLALAHAIEQLLMQPEFAQRLGSNGRKKVHERFTVDRITDLMEHGYQLAIDKYYANSVPF